MQTIVAFALPPYETDPAVRKAAKLIQQGELVVFPTETVFGIGANALDKNACRKIFEAKNRPIDNPLIVHLAAREDIYRYAGSTLPPYAKLLIDRFAPGPLTIVVQNSGAFPDVVTAKLPTVCLRVPSHPVANALISAAGVPIAAPSANRSTRPSATNARDAWEDLRGRVSMIVDSSMTPGGIESTIVDCTGEHPAVLRDGIISREEIAAAVGIPLERLGDTRPTITPGTRYKHYAPDVHVHAVRSGENESKSFSRAIELYRKGKNVRVITLNKLSTVPAEIQVVLETPEAFARSIFSLFRAAERDGVEHLFVVLLPEEGIGRGVNERIRKAAGER